MIMTSDNYKKMYAEKKMTADETAALVKSGDWLDYGWCTATSYDVDRALAKRMPELTDVKIRGGILCRRPAIFDIPDPAAHFSWNSWHFSGIDRKAVAEGFCYYSPLRYSELPRHYREMAEPIDLAVFQVAPMDEQGWFNFGPNASHMIEVCRRAKKVVVEVDTNMPRCLGGYNTAVHVSDVYGIVEGTNPGMPQLGSAAPNDVD